jgi:hypothetical protein
MESNVMRGTLACDGDHERGFGSTATSGSAGFAIVVDVDNLDVRFARPYGQGKLCY